MAGIVKKVYCRRPYRALSPGLDIRNALLLPRFNRYEARLLECEGRVCNGSYIWRIENYRQCRQDAINGVMTAIYSPAFSLYGYKLCMRINLNGVDDGEGEHVALYMHVMQEGNDAVLEWPLKLRKVEFTILDKFDATEARHHISRSLEVNPYASFQRPTTPRSHQGHGYSEFAPIARIRDGHHVINDTLFVCIQVMLYLEDTHRIFSSDN